MIIYRVEVDYGIDLQWTEGYYTTLEKAKFKANFNFDSNLYKKEVDVSSDENDSLAYRLDAVDNNLNWHFSVYVYRIEVEDGENKIDKLESIYGKLLLLLILYLGVVLLHLSIMDGSVSSKKECPKSRVAYYTGTNVMCNFLNYMGEDLE